MRNNKFPNPQTKLCFSIGFPTDKQKTLFMHNAGFEKLNLNFLYLVQEFSPERLKEGIRSLSNLNVAGVSVSMPHKQEIIKYLDVLQDDVKKIGACNTVHIEEDKLVGYNSDYRGAIICLQRKLDTLKGKLAVIIGAGGTARALTYGLLEQGANVRIVNRTIEKAEALAKEFNVDFRDLDAENAFNGYDIIINATSVGSKVEESCNCRLCRFLGFAQSSADDMIFSEDKIALDVVFQRNTTEFIEAAKKQGHNVIYGHEMLVEQGAFQFELFTGAKAPVDIMYAELKKTLEDW